MAIRQNRTMAIEKYNNLIDCNTCREERVRRKTIAPATRFRYNIIMKINRFNVATRSGSVFIARWRVAGKPVPDAGPDVRAARPHAPRVPDEKRPGWRPTLLGVRGPAVDGSDPSGRAQGVRPGRAHQVHQRAAGHGVPGEDDEPEGLAEAEGPLAVCVLGPDGAGPDGAGPGGLRLPRKEHRRTAHAAVVHRDRARPHAVRGHNHVEHNAPLSRRWSGGTGTGTRTRRYTPYVYRYYSLFEFGVVTQ